jgi:hypothetical protein
MRRAGPPRPQPDVSRDAIDQWAFCALTNSPGARAFYDAHRAAGTPTTRPCAPWATDSSASSTAAYATAPTTTKQKPGLTAPPQQLDALQPWGIQAESTGER